MYQTRVHSVSDGTQTVVAMLHVAKAKHGHKYGTILSFSMHSNKTESRFDCSQVVQKIHDLIVSMGVLVAQLLLNL